MTRSWWGWGKVEDAVTGAEAEALVSRAAPLLAGHDFTEHAPPSVDSLELPAPRVTPPGSLAPLTSQDPEDRARHAMGQAFRDVVRKLEGRIDHAPDLVARPRTEQDVVDLLDWASRESITVVPFGGGTSVVGGIEHRPEPGSDAPVGPTISLDLERLDRVLDVDRTSRAARIQGGVLGPHLEDQLRPHGLTLRFYPQSFEFSTLGGWLATRAGGHYATLHTHIDDVVESMRVVTPTGTSESRRLPGSGAGPSPDRLFLGSEGMLGVITEAWMRLQDRPLFRASASVTFDDFDRAVTATRTIAQSGLHPANCRLLDPAEAFLNAGTPTSGGLLVLTFESADHPVSASLDRALEITGDHGGVVASRHDKGTGDDEPAQRHTPTPSAGHVGDSADSWKSSFIRMPYQRDAMARRSMVVETFETACTWDRFEELHAAIQAAAQEAITKVCGIGVVTCRFTHVYPDGPAPYYGIYAPGRWGSLVAQWDEIKAAVSDAIIGAGGTITHHHAVGRDHRPWYDQQRPDVFARAFAAAKSELDPAGILNPGVLLAPR